MPKRSAEWTGGWVASKLEEHDKVERIEQIAPQVLRVIRKEEGAFLVATIAATRVEPSVIESLLTEREKIKFIVNVPADSMWSGAAIELAEAYGAAFGGLRDLMSAMSEPDIGSFVRKEFRFVERGLRQHTRVYDLERIHDRKYVVKRRDLPDMRVVLINEYDLTSDHVRTARDRYGQFKAILITNPNGRITSSAEEVLASMGAKAFKWGEFLGRLNRR
jgi:hypothetical protein